jgi:phage tail protein X
VASIGTVQVIGSPRAAGTIVEVETNTKAIRRVIRPDDVDFLSARSIGTTSGVVAAGLAANAPVYFFSVSPFVPYVVSVVRRVDISVGNAGTAFAAGVATFQMFAARTSGNDSGGLTASIANHNTKLRTNMGFVNAASMNIANTVALNVGTRVLDAQPIASVSGSVIGAPGEVVIPPSTLWDSRMSEYPLVFTPWAAGGFEIQATVPATGTWTMSVSIQWEEFTWKDPLTP